MGKTLVHVLLTAALAGAVFGCAREFYSVSCAGTVADAVTGIPIEMAEIQSAAFYQENIDQLAESRKTTHTGAGGTFSLNFERAHHIKLAISSPGYQPEYLALWLRKKNTIKTIFLQPSMVDTTIKIVMINNFEVNPNTPYLRERNYIYPAQPQKEWWGYDFLSGMPNRLPEPVDLWLELDASSNTGYLLKTPKTGGIIPIFKSDLLHPVYIEPAEAPLSGYLNTYKPLGVEAGYFILCRDGHHVAKIIPEKAICIVTRKARKPFREEGIRFNYLFRNDSAGRRLSPFTNHSDPNRKTSTPDVKQNTDSAFQNNLSDIESTITYEWLSKPNDI
jgi:hypothetical protein